ncbi:phage terminase large subunit family protein [Patescibacteria group bacterium]|nr:phage terminase large subunit family protein [Patescibacteria group bacterium]
MSEPAIDNSIELLMSADPWAWCYYSRLRLAGGQYQVSGHEYQVEPMRCDDRVQVFKKATQMGFTELLIIRALHALKHGRYPQGAMYLFPTSDEVSLFSKSRFKPFLSANRGAIGKYVRETDSVDIKRVGDSFLYFRGARLSQTIEGTQKTSSKLKSTPVDAVFFDEFDEMDPESEDLVIARMEHSTVKERTYLANPTVPDFGIDKLWQQSDQRVWMIECDHCGRETCLELEFPNCLKRQRDGSVIRVCKSCGGEIYPKDGFWVPQYSGKDITGWWISHLNSTYKEPKELLDAYENPDTDLVRFHNLNLGMAYIKAEDRLTVNDVLLTCGPDKMAMSSDGPCCMGVDVGGKLHVVIGQKIGDKGIKILKMVRVSTFEDVWDLAQKYRVQSAVFDLKPEIHKVREFCATAQYSCFGCDYSEEQRGVAAWNESNNVVTVNRTEICDASHKLVTTPGRLELPRKDEEVEEFAKEMIATAKVLEEDKKTGSMVYRYRKLGDDHYRHALNYLLLASVRIQAVARIGKGVVVEPTRWIY